MLQLQKKLILLPLILFLIGTVGIVQSGTAAAAPKTKPAVSVIGIVDYDSLLDQHPDMPEANKAMQAEGEKAKQEFESKSAGLSDTARQELDMQLRQRLAYKRQELLNSITAKIDTVIKEVADAKGMTVVMQKEAAIYGGLDITKDVLTKIIQK